MFCAFPMIHVKVIESSITQATLSLLRLVKLVPKPTRSDTAKERRASFSSNNFESSNRTENVNQSLHNKTIRMS